MRVSGQRSLNSDTQAAKCAAPPSRRSSRSTEVMTTYARPISATASARWAGSSASRGFGRPWATSQNGQRRVQRSPMIMNVAVPWLKHSDRFGHAASSQTVCRPWRRSRPLMRRTPGPIGALTRIHGGLRGIGPCTGMIFTGLRAVFSAPRWERAGLAGGSSSLIESIIAQSQGAQARFPPLSTVHRLTMLQNRSAVFSAS